MIVLSLLMKLANQRRSDKSSLKRWSFLVQAPSDWIQTVHVCKRFIYYTVNSFNDYNGSFLSELKLTLEIVIMFFFKM